MKRSALEKLSGARQARIYIMPYDRIFCITAQEIVDPLPAILDRNEVDSSHVSVPCPRNLPILLVPPVFIPSY
jgi:hypothetical protein